MKHLSPAILLLGLSFQAAASIDSTFFQPLDIQSIHDQEVANERKGVAPRFAIAQKVAIAADEWVQDGDKLVWSHEVMAPTSVSLNFGFSKFYLPEGATLNIYSSDRTKFIRSFTSADNNIHRELWTPVIMSDDVMIEVTAPEAVAKDVELELSTVGQGFRTFAESTQKSGSCNVDVACKESKGWDHEVNTVAVISTGGSSFCTGFMVNNTNNDKTPYFMTAAHCRISASNAASLVTYWNYQTSKCRGARDGKLDQFNTGAVHLATNTKSDFTLVKLLQEPKPEYHVNYAGWDATGKLGTPATGIHHPNVDEKSISFENDPVGPASYLGSDTPGDGTHVRITDWDVGTTEPGSSGSPLFNANHQVIGQLHGGGAACGNDESDYYGAFHVSWKGDGSKTGSLKPHLDPKNTGRMTVDTL
jgi:hypothetical protein